MKNKWTSIIITVVIVLAVGWRSYLKYEKQNLQDANIEATCTPVRATVKRVSPQA